MYRFMMLILMLIPLGIFSQDVIITLKNGETHTGSLAASSDTSIVIMTDPSQEKSAYALDAVAEVVIGDVTLQGRITRERIVEAQNRGEEKKLRRETATVRPQKKTARNAADTADIPWQPIPAAADSSDRDSARASATPAFSPEELSRLIVCAQCGAVNLTDDTVCVKCSRKLSDREMYRIPKGRNSQPENRTPQKYTGTIQIAGGALGVLFAVLDATQPWNLLLQTSGQNTGTRYVARSGWTYMHSAAVGVSIGLIASGSMTLYFASK